MLPKMKICLFIILAAKVTGTAHGLLQNDVYNNKRRQDSYDYVIVGGGSTGSVVANRLSENQETKVLLLEAGGLPSSMTEVPYFIYMVMGNNDTDWGYYTEPQKNACLGLPEKKSFWSRYKGLGGCSVHNFMVYNRGNHKDYDNWESNGCTGWSWLEVFPFFTKSENNLVEDYADNGFHGTDGYLTVSPPSYKNDIRTAFLEAGTRLGYGIVDYNGASQLGFSEPQLTQRYGRRCSTEKAFLRPAAQRPNLDILYNARVLKIYFGKDNQAESVEYEQDSTMYNVSAREEIVLSAGAIGTPQLLMLSGIGPKDHLEKLKIPVIADLPVGLNLQDHVSTSGLYWTLNTSIGVLHDRALDETSVADFEEGKGMLTSPGTVENIIYINSKYQNSTDWPDLELETSSSLVFLTLPEYAHRDGTAIFPTLARPKSRGVIKLRSRNPSDHPIIDLQYFSEEEDLLRLVEGMKFSRTIMASEPFKYYDPRPILEAVPLCQHLDWQSDDYLKCVARTLTQTMFHPSGTAKMGNPNDPTTVVDPELRLKGVKGLRVADASIIPFIPSGNINAVCIMIGEKAADMMKAK